MSTAGALKGVLVAGLALAGACQPFDTRQPPRLTGSIVPPSTWSVAAANNLLRAGSTVSLIVPATGRSLLTAKTDDSNPAEPGRFDLDFAAPPPYITGPFTLDPGIYYLETSYYPTVANLPPLSLRTIVSYTGMGWKSITNGSEGGAVKITATTTAVSVIQASDPAIALGQTLGTVNPVSDTPIQIGTYTATNINSVKTRIQTAITADADPIGSTILKTGSVPASEFSPGLTRLTISGFGFAGVPEQNRVRFRYTDGGPQSRTVAATAASASSITVPVPAGLKGTVTVDVTGGRAWSNSFNMAPWQPGKVVAGTAVTNECDIAYGRYPYLAWIDSRNGTPEVFVARANQFANPPTLTTIANPKPGSTATSVSLISDAGGVPYLVFTADGSTYFTTSNDTGSTWAPPVEITLAGAGAADQASLAQMPDGRLAAVWLQTPTLAPRRTTLIYAERAANGTWTSREVKNNSGSPMTNVDAAAEPTKVARRPVIVVGDNVDIAWTEDAPRRACHSRQIGTSWSNKAYLSPATMQVGDQLALTTGGSPSQLHAAWSQDTQTFTGTPPGMASLWSGLFTSPAWAATAVENAPGTPPFGLSPVLTVSSDNSQSLFWSEGALHPQIRMSQKPAGGAWSLPYTLNDSRPSRFRVAYNRDSNQYHALWRQQDTQDLWLWTVAP